MKYTDYSFYSSEYGGSKIPLESFEIYILKASFYISNITFNRVDKHNILDEVKYATCAVADEMYKIDKDGGIKVSESVGNYSVTYKSENGTDSGSNENKKYYNIARLFLESTNLLYRGV